MGKLGLSAYQRQMFRRLLREATDVRLYRRVLAILEVDRGSPVNEVARLLNVSGQSIYNWIERFQHQGSEAALADRYGVGRPSLWTAKRQARLRAVLDSSPQAWGYLAADWTVPLLQEQLARCTGEWFSEDTVRRELPSAEFDWFRGALIDALR